MALPQFLRLLVVPPGWEISLIQQDNLSRGRSSRCRVAGLVTTLKAPGNAEAANRRRADYDALIVEIERFQTDKAEAPSPEERKIVDDFVERLESISEARREVGNKLAISA